LKRKYENPEESEESKEEKELEDIEDFWLQAKTEKIRGAMEKAYFELLKERYENPGE
jgi:hypothetical protein